MEQSCHTLTRISPVYLPETLEESSCNFLFITYNSLQTLVSFPTLKSMKNTGPLGFLVNSQLPTDLVCFYQLPFELG